MNHRHLFACITMFLISSSAMALDGKSCEAKATHMKQAEHDSFMKACLAQLSDPSNVKEAQQQDKRARCEQNAKNQNKQGNDKASYVSSCMTENEAAAVKQATPTETTTVAKAAPAEKPKRVAANGPAKAPAAKHGPSCTKQANKKGLKGDARKQFLKECSAA